MERLGTAFGLSIVGLAFALFGVTIIDTFAVVGNLSIVVAVAIAITTIRFLLEFESTAR